MPIYLTLLISYLCCKVVFLCLICFRLSQELKCEEDVIPDSATLSKTTRKWILAQVPSKTALYAKFQLKPSSTDTWNCNLKGCGWVWDEEESEEEALHWGSLQIVPFLAWRKRRARIVFGKILIGLWRCTRINDGSGGEWRLDFLVGNIFTSVKRLSIHLAIVKRVAIFIGLHSQVGRNLSTVITLG